MKELRIFIVLLLVLGFYSCEDDIIGENDGPTVIMNEPVVTYTSSVSGIVTDINGQQLENVEVNYGGVDFTTDQNGYFKIEDYPVSEDGGLLTFSYPDHFDNYKFFIPSANENNFLRVKLIKRTLSGNVNAQSGGVVEVENEARIIFDNGSFVDENGFAYNGNVSVYAHWFDPSYRDFSLTIPGDLRAVQADGQLAQLATYGMMAVELEGQSGEKLQLAEGKTASLEFPLPQFLLNSAPEVIETWSLDEETAYWIEEDVAYLTDGKYTAEVSHFSFWNCDAPFPLVNVSGKVIDQNGNELPGLRICITAFDGALTGYGWTGSNGAFAGKVPKGIPLTIQIKDDCGEVVFEEEFGPFISDASFGEIQVNLNTIFTVSGQLVCNGMSVSTGYVEVIVDELYNYIIEVDQDGFFEYPVLFCDATTVSVQGFDLANARISEVLSYPIGGSDLDVGTIEVCEELDEYIIYKIGTSNEVLIDDPEASIQNGKLILNGYVDTLESGLALISPAAQITSSGAVEYLEASLLNNNGFFEQFLCEDGTVPDCASVNLEITQTGSEGDYVMGSFIGNATDQNGNTKIIMGQYRVKIDYVGDALSISGLSWVDSNQDGIQQAAEPLLDKTNFSLFRDGSYLDFRNANPDGSYEFNYLLPGNYSIIARASQGFQLTLQDQGSDDAIDSDFSPNGVELTITNSSIENINAGYYTNGTFSCFTEINNLPNCSDVNNGLVTVIMNGVAPYQLTLNHNQISQSFTSTGDEYTIPDLEAGVYSVDITDSFGSSCSTIFTLISDDEMECEIITTEANCGAPDGTARVEVAGGTPPYSYEWSNGATGEFLDNLPSGDYAVTVTDINGCQSVCATGLFSTDELFVFIDGEIADCDPSGLEVFLYANVLNGSGNYSYAWSVSNEDNDNIIAFVDLDNFNGQIDLIVTDLETGCEAEATYFVDFFPSASINGRVWSEDPSGTANLYDQGLEGGITNVTIELYFEGDASPFMTTQTTAGGFYNFFGLPFGTYIVKIITPVGTTLVLKDFGNNDSLDSDFDPDTGETDPIWIEECYISLSYDAGIIE